MQPKSDIRAPVIRHWVRHRCFLSIISTSTLHKVVLQFPPPAPNRVAVDP